MRKLFTLAVCLTVVGAASATFAKGPLLGLGSAGIGQIREPVAQLGTPVLPADPNAQYAPGSGPMLPLPAYAEGEVPGTLPGPIVSGPVISGPVGPPIELFPNVRYKDVRRIAPCSNPIIVQVKDPCATRCGTCEPQCVAVQICVPPCECPPRITTSRDGCKVTYNYGKYKVHVLSCPRKGEVVVNYDS